MLGLQQDNLLRGHGLLKDVAQSVLSEQELALLMYYLNQYQQYDMSINDLMPSVFSLLDSPEKVVKNCIFGRKLIILLYSYNY